MNLVPGMNKAVLSQIVGQRLISCKLTQEVSYLRLVLPNQFAEGRRVLARYHTRDKQLVVDDYAPWLAVPNLAACAEAVHQ